MTYWPTTYMHTTEPMHVWDECYCYGTLVSQLLYGIVSLPAQDHELVHGSWAAGRWGLAVTNIQQRHQLQGQVRHASHEYH